MAMVLFLVFFNDTATTEIYTLSLHDALPICRLDVREDNLGLSTGDYVYFAHSFACDPVPEAVASADRSEEHTSELQSRQYLVCRLLLEHKKKKSLRS